MSLGEKIRCARKNSGMSQEQLAQKLCVSRSAIAKWETDKGLPDVENLKTLSRLLNVSVDSLLDDSTHREDGFVREYYNQAAYGRGCSKVKKGRMLRSKFPDAKIFALSARPDLPNEGNIVNSTLGFLTPVPFGMPEYLKSVRNLERDYYLIQQASGQLFDMVTDDTVSYRPIDLAPAQQTFHLEGWTFIRCHSIQED